MAIFSPPTVIPRGTSVSDWLTQRSQMNPVAGASAPLPQQAPSPFVWGANGQQTTPQQRSAPVDMSPIGHWTQGLSRVANALVDGMEERRDASFQAGFPDIPRQGLGFVNPFTAYRRTNGGLY